MKALLKTIKNVILLYLLIVLAAFFLQDRLMYRPDETPFHPAVVQAEALEPLDLKSSDGLTLHHWFSPPRYGTSPTVVYFQGNAGGLADRAYKFRPWIQKGYGVFLVGYRGYGNSGNPSEETLYADARQVVFYLMDRLSVPDSIILYGESLGTGIATQMALEFPVGGLILEAPYTSYPDAGAFHYPFLPVHWLARDQYNTIDKIAQVKAPLLVIHGDADGTVPFEQGEKVFEAAQDPKAFLVLHGAGHGNVYDFGAAEAVDKFLSNPQADESF